MREMIDRRASAWQTQALSVKLSVKIKVKIKVNIKVTLKVMLRGEEST